MHFVDREEAFDEGVALFFRAPHSYTGEDVVELSCHGGSAVARRLVEACLAAGAQPAAPGEYTRRAFLNGKLGLTQAEAVITGFFNSTPARVTFVFIITPPPYLRIPVRLCRHVCYVPENVHRYLLICRHMPDRHRFRMPFFLP